MTRGCRGLATCVALATFVALVTSCMERPGAHRKTVKAEAVTQATNGAVREVPSQYASIQVAIDAADPGDTIRIAPGTYREALIVNKDNVTIVGADPANPPVLDGSDPTFTPTWTQVTPTIYSTPYAWGGRVHLTNPNFRSFRGGDDWQFVPLHVYEDGELLKGYTGPNSFARPLATNAELDPTSTAGSDVSVACEQNVQNAGRFRWDPSTDTLFVWTKNGDSPANHTYAIPDPTRLNVARIVGSGVTLQHLIFQYSAGWAVRVWGDNTVVDHNYFVNDFYSFQAENVSGLTVSNNFLRNRGHWKHYSYNDGKNSVLGSPAIDITGLDNTADVDVFNNVISEFYICVTPSSIRTKVHDNICARVSSIAINTSDTTNIGPVASRDVDVFNNIVHHGCDAAFACSYVTLGPVNLYRNVVYALTNLVKDGTPVEHGRAGACHVYQNTAALIQRTIHDAYDFPVEKNTVVRNNLLHFAGKSGWTFYWAYQDKVLANWDFFPFGDGPDSDFNLYWQTQYAANSTQKIGVFAYFGSPGSRYYTPAQFTQMTAETGLDIHSMQQDPLLKNRAALGAATRPAFDANGEVEALSVSNHQALIAEGFDCAFAREFAKTWDYFGVDNGSPTVDAGTAIPTAWPDTQPRVPQPNLGAGPLPAWAAVSRCDAGPVDAVPVDGGSVDAASVDAESMEAAVATAVDAESVDAESVDDGAGDNGPGGCECRASARGGSGGRGGVGVFALAVCVAIARMRRRASGRRGLDEA